MSTSNPYLTVDQQIVGDIFTNTEVMDNLTVLCDEFGSRFGGTEGERLAAEFMRDKLMAYGLQNVHLEEIEYVGWTRGQATLEIIDPIQKTIPCITLPHSPPTDMEGLIVDLGDGVPAEFDQRAEEIKGNIVLTTSVINPGGSSRWIHRNEKYGRSLLAGAAGFIFVNHYPGYGPATGGIGKDNEAPIPGFSIAKEDGNFIQRLIKRNGSVKIRLTSTDHCQPAISWNVVGDIPGISYPDEIVMLGSHYDGHDISQGATDPASGTVAVLEAARALAQYAPQLARTVRVVLWGVEEIGLIGSIYYVKQHAAELDKIRFYLNMDACGYHPNDVVFNEWADLKAPCEQWRAEMALDFAVRQSLNAHSDHFPFFMAGVPTGALSQAAAFSGGRGYGHTYYDTLDKVEIVHLRAASALAARLALRIANEENWPVARRNQQAVLDILDSPDYQEEAAFEARLAAYYKEHGLGEVR